MFSCEFCEISKNTFSYRTPLVATKFLNLTKQEEVLLNDPNSTVAKFSINSLILNKEMDNSAYGAFSFPYLVQGRVERVRTVVVTCLEF